MKGRRYPWLAATTVIGVAGLVIAGRTIAIYNSTPLVPPEGAEGIGVVRTVEAGYVPPANSPGVLVGLKAAEPAKPAQTRPRHHHRSKVNTAVVASGTCVDLEKERIIPMFLDSMFELRQIGSVRLPSSFHGEELPLMERLIEADEHRTQGMFPLQPHQRGQGC